MLLESAHHPARRNPMARNVIGVGTPSGAPEPDGKGDFVRDASGRPRMTRLQTEELQRIASAGGGEFVRASGVSSLLAALEAQQARNLESDNSSVSKTRLSTWQNEGVWLLPPLLLLAAWLARRGWV
jgi:Ca-activated chloride channel family protein